jgi:phospholipid/cholesterol/gamma-HCH transport system ATP-binding protein
MLDDADRSSLITDEQAPIAEWIGVHKRFGHKVVLDGLDLEVRRGETLVLLGRSGTGKSVTLRLLIGLLRPDRGQVRVAGHDVTRMRESELTRLRRHLGMVFQGGALFDSMSVLENVAYGLREHLRWPEARIVARVRECLGLVDLTHAERLEPGALSGGMRKRVAIARAIATSPELLLYDEPTTGLDPATTNQVNRLITSLQARLGVTSIVVTHDMPSAFAVADRMVLLEKGRLVWTGTPEDARERPPPALAGFLDVPDEEEEEGQGDPWTSPAASR